MNTPPPGRVGANHPQTAKDAADTARWAALDHRELILLRMLKNGYRGVTAAEISHELGISTNIAGSRLLELRADKSATGLYPCLAKRSGERRALPGGKAGDVHVLNEDGRKAAERIFARLGGNWPMTMREAM